MITLFGQPTWVRAVFTLVVLVLSATSFSVSAQAPRPEVSTQTEMEAGPTGTDGPAISSGEALILKLRQGGITIVFLLVVSVFAVACTLERLVHLRLGKIAPTALSQKLDQLSDEGRLGEIAAAAGASDSTLGRVVTEMTRHHKLERPELTTLATDVAAREMKLHLLRAYPLMICATLSPLLGLFGTVAGMIGAFDKVAAAGSLGDASMLGGDISKALITTAAGLVVAIPTLGLYHYFRSRTNLMAIVLEEQISELLLHWNPVRETEDEAAR